jgi:hypothetical protein
MHFGGRGVLAFDGLRAEGQSAGECKLYARAAQTGTHTAATAFDSTDAGRITGASTN